MKYSPLKRQEVKNVIHGKGDFSRVPMMIHFWTKAEVFGERQEEADALLQKYPMDVQLIIHTMPPMFMGTESDPKYRWIEWDDSYKKESAGLDEMVLIPDMGELDKFMADFPSPEYPKMFATSVPSDGRYRLGHWWYTLFERHWSFRGMVNALTDYYEEPEQVHKLFRKVTDFYLRVIERGKLEDNWDGVIVSDDIGTQTGPFFSPAIFKEFFKPYYKEMIEKAHSLDMDFWLHSCGNIELFLPDFIEIGLDVIHPIQKHTMDEQKIAQQFGKDICIWAGFDVQQVIPYGTPEEVRAEVRHMIDTFYRPEGRLMMTAGNGITEDCSIESLEALLDECYEYGKK